MAPERQILLRAVALQVEAARSRLVAREARLETICSRLRDFRADELLAAQWRVRESLEEVSAWCDVFDRETYSSTS